MSMRYFSEPGLKGDDSAGLLRVLQKFPGSSPSYRDQTRQSAFPEVLLIGITDMP